MKMYCSGHKKTHNDFEWKSYIEGKKTVNLCREVRGMTSFTKLVPVIRPSKTDRRINHWKDIKSRVTTHEGEVLSGKKGAEYQKKYSQQYLGRDLSRPVDFSRGDYQQELRK